MLLSTGSTSARKVPSPGMRVLHARRVQWSPVKCPFFKKEFLFNFKNYRCVYVCILTYRRVLAAGGALSAGARRSRGARGPDLGARAVCLGQGWEPVPDVREPLRARPAVGDVTSPWGRSGSLWSWKAGLRGGGEFRLRRVGREKCARALAARPLRRRAHRLPSPPPAPRAPAACRSPDRALGGWPALWAAWVPREASPSGRRLCPTC